MRDDKIIAMFFDRDENAIKETENKYNRYLFKIAYNILSDREESEEAVNDAYLAAWNTIPPQNPSELSLYLAKLVRRISIDKLRK
ncbi:MAG: RNA polymerase subunit sigma-70, partial [Clostridia bacterium]|nr:RNA polymerase subunit sigma-70 [Clostridia bacterium]